VAHWRSYKNTTYGVALRYPETLERLDEPSFLGGSDFVDEDGVVTLQSFAIAAEMYPNANFDGGSFTVFVNPTIRSEATCRQFGWLMRPIPALTARGIQYPGVSRTGVATGHASDQYHFHTYENGLCYEFAFDFGSSTGTGMEPTFLCSVQPVLEQNQRELMKALLSQVQFVTPGLRSERVVKSPSSLSYRGAAGGEESGMILYFQSEIPVRCSGPDSSLRSE